MPSAERRVRTAAGLIAAAGLLACAVAIFSDQLGIGAEAARGMFGWRRALLLGIGIVGLALGALLLLRPRIDSALADSRFGRHVQRLAERHQAHLAIALLALLGFVLVWTRLMHIGVSLWHDEAEAILTHNTGPTAAFGGHVLFHQLSWATTSLFSLSEPVQRFWSVVPGILAIAFVTWWAWRRIGAVVAIAFAALAVATPLHLDVVPQARGYGLTLLAAALMLIAADRLTRTYSRWTLLGFLAAGVVGVWTLIFFAASFLGQIVSLLRWPRLRPMAIGVLAAATVLSLIFHRPVGYGQVQGELIPLGGAVLLERTLEWLVLPTATLLITDPSSGLIDHPSIPGWAFLAPLALIAFAVVALWRRGESGLALLLVLPPLLFNLAFSIGDINTVARHQIVLLPHVLLLVAVGIAELGRIVAASRVLKPLAVAAGVIAVLVLAKATLDEGRTRGVPLENFKQVAQVVRGSDADTVITDSNRPTGLFYYLPDLLEVQSADEVESLICDPPHQLVYIRHVPLPPEAWGFWEPASLDCLAEVDAARVRVPQRTRGGAIDVWIVEPEADADTLADDVPWARGL